MLVEFSAITHSGVLLSSDSASDTSCGTLLALDIDDLANASAEARICISKGTDSRPVNPSYHAGAPSAGPQASPPTAFHL